MTDVLIVDDQIGMREMLTEALEEKGFAVRSAALAQEAMAALDAQVPDFLITDLHLPDGDGLQVIAHARSVAPQLPILLITAHASIDGAVAAMRQGANDYLVKPFSLTELEVRVQRALREARVGQEAARLRAELRAHYGQMVGHSKVLQSLFRDVDKLADSPVSVLLLGESGTGKELLAREIHDRSPRREQPFIAVNCAAIPENLLESELFGHKRGAFTGAIHDQVGRIAQADGGTLFLDEIGDLNLSAQVKLLRFLQERELRRVGDHQLLHVDVRVIAATHHDLVKAIATGQFREDLFFRLSVISLHLPPLRERLEDLGELVEHFVQKWAAALHREVGIDPSFVEACEAYTWPGNVRELENAVERAIVLCEDNTISDRDLLFAPTQTPGPQTQVVGIQPFDSDASLTVQVERVERDLIYQALQSCAGNTSQTAEALGIKRTTLQYKIRKYQLDSEALR